MKKVLFGVMLLGSMNVFSAQILNNRIHEIFPNREVRSLIAGNYNLEKELAVISTAKSNNQAEITKLENDVKSGLKMAIQNYAYDILKEKIVAVLVTGPGFDNNKMKDFAKEISERLLPEGERRGYWSTSKGKTVVLYTISKEKVKEQADIAFNDRINSVIEKLNEYKAKINN